MILALETATNVCSIALVADQKLVVEKNLIEPRAHAQKLGVMIQDLMAEVGLNFSDLEAIAVSKGPGSYTGLRIGVSTAKGLAWAHDVPIIGVNSLEGMAYTLLEEAKENDVVCALIDARRDEIFMAAFRKTADGFDWHYETCSCLVDELEAKLALNSNDQLWLIGDGAAKSEKGFTRIHPKVLPIETHFAKASGIGLCAFRRMQNKEMEDVASFEPYYFKEFETRPSKKIPFAIPER